MRVVPTRAALQFVGAATWAALSGQPVTTEVWDDVARGAARADRPAGRPGRGRTGHGRPARPGRRRPGRRPAHQHAAHRPLPGADGAGDAHRDVAAPGHPGQRRHAAPPRRPRARPGRRAGSPAPTPARAACPSRPRSSPPCQPRAGRAAPRHRDLAGRHVVVSAGGTREHLDPVRFLGNRSSGRQGYALAATALARGAEVTLVAANVALPDPAGAKVVRVVSAARAAATPSCAAAVGADAVVMAAAVADFRPVTPRTPRSRRCRASPTEVALVRNPDVLAEARAAAPGASGAGRRRVRRRDRRRRGRRARATAGPSSPARAATCSWSTRSGQRHPTGFEGTHNAAVMLGADGAETAVPLGRKEALADAVWDPRRSGWPPLRLPRREGR